MLGTAGGGGRGMQCKCRRSAEAIGSVQLEYHRPAKRITGKLGALPVWGKPVAYGKVLSATPDFLMQWLPICAKHIDGFSTFATGVNVPGRNGYLDGCSAVRRLLDGSIISESEETSWSHLQPPFKLAPQDDRKLIPQAAPASGLSYLSIVSETRTLPKQMSLEQIPLAIPPVQLVSRACLVQISQSGEYCTFRGAGEPQ